MTIRWLTELFVHDWALKLTALALSVLLWFAVRSETPTRAQITRVPVQVELAQEGWIVAAPPSPDTVTVIFEGPVRELFRLGLELPRIVVPVSEVQDTVAVRALDFRFIRYPEGRPPERTQAVDIRPSTVTLFFERIVTLAVPVAVRLTGELRADLALTGPALASPAEVQVSGPARRVARLDSLRLEPIDLSEVSGRDELFATVDVTGLDELVVTPRRVRVLLPIGAVVTDTIAPDSIVADTVPLEDLPADPPAEGEEAPAAEGEEAPAAEGEAGAGPAGEEAGG